MLLTVFADMDVDPTKEELSKLTSEIMHNMGLLQHDQVEFVMLDSCTKLVHSKLLRDFHSRLNRIVCIISDTSL